LPVLGLKSIQKWDRLCLFRGGRNADHASGKSILLFEKNPLVFFYFTQVQNSIETFHLPGILKKTKMKKQN